MNELKQRKLNSIIVDTEKATTDSMPLCFLPGDRTPKHTAGKGFLGRIQNFLKRHGKLYCALVRILAPVVSSWASRVQLKKLLDSYGQDHVIVNVGSGPGYFKNRKDIINVDIFAFEEIDLVSDATSLPIKNNSVDLVINVAMMEHLNTPEKVVHEMHRILKQDGTVFCYVPFMVPFHAAPNDFFRWTISGAKQLFADFGEVEVVVGAGPTSGMLWVLQEWLSVLLSFGSRTLHDIIFMLLMIVTSPIKLLDFILVHFPCSENIASGFSVIAKKSPEH
jgi:SAM-dependent methyltransferase